MRVLTVLLTAVTLTGCVKYPDAVWSEWRAKQPVVSSPVGVITKMRGMDCWSHGVPDRPYRVIALIEQDFIDDSDYLVRAPVTLVKAAREHKADALIRREDMRENRGYEANWSMYGGGGRNRRQVHLEYWAIQYLPDSTTRTD